MKNPHSIPSGNAIPTAPAWADVDSVDLAASAQASSAMEAEARRADALRLPARVVRTASSAGDQRARSGTVMQLDYDLRVAYVGDLKSEAVFSIRSGRMEPGMFDELECGHRVDFDIAEPGVGKACVFAADEHGWRRAPIRPAAWTPELCPPTLVRQRKNKKRS